MLTPGTTLQNRYIIEQVLERGGDYLVYLGQDQRLNKTVSIKETFFQAESFLKQFEFEARLLANLKHPVLPVVTDYFLEPDGQYLVMEYIPGISLHAYLAEQTEHSMSERMVLLFLAPLLDALEYLHAYDPPIIHRNIHPEHIWLGKNGRVYLTNFSVSKAYDAHKETSIGAESVAPGYSPIEQYGGGSTDARSDLYALGATIYTMLSGKKPPPATQRIAVDRLQPLRELNPTISTRLEAVVARLMAPQAEDRYQDIASLRQDLPAQPR